MADYASTVTLDLPKAQRISRELGILTGEINITNYNSTQSAETDISGKFKSLLVVMVTSTENGYVCSVDSSCKFTVYEAGADGAELDECANDTDCGTFAFIAIGTL